MPNGGFRGRIKTGLGLVKQTKNWGEQKGQRKLKDEKITICLCKGSSIIKYHGLGAMIMNYQPITMTLNTKYDDDDDDDGNNGWDCCARRLISREIPTQDN